jgi:GGDEF domain-containing protein
MGNDRARRLSVTVRSGEVLARVGGEEFAWLLPASSVGTTASWATASATPTACASASLSDYVTAAGSAPSPTTGSWPARPRGIRRKATTNAIAIAPAMPMTTTLIDSA